jgi:ADP-L-glycero-D-manno-heptose 6-epimerase
MIIVTGGAGFIGSNIVKGLNARGRTDIIVVDDLTLGRKFVNLVDANFVDYIDYQDFLELIRDNGFQHEKIDVIFHQGACSDTMEWDGRFMMRNNFEYSKELMLFCQSASIPFIYASSAAVYGGGQVFEEERQYEKPLNVYGFSKFQFDQCVRFYERDFVSQVVGLRYFNVYGPGEAHKGKMASVAFHHYNQIRETGVVKLFGEYDGYGPGEQTRDFVYIDDIVNINLFFFDHPEISGIFNAGTGRSEPFNAIATAVIKWFKRGEIEYIPFPDSLKGSYQSFTQADIRKLRMVGYNEPFKTVAEGVAAYLEILGKSS